MKISKKILLTAFCICARAAAFAGHPLVTDDAYTQGKNHVQLELVQEYRHSNDGSVKTEGYFVPLTPTLTFGAAEKADIIASGGYLQTRTEEDGATTRSHESAFALAAKWQFAELENNTFLAAKLALGMPLERNGGGEIIENLGYEGYFILSKEYAPFKIHFSTGWLGQSADGVITSAWHNSAAFEYNFYKKFSLVGNAGFDLEEGATRYPYFLLAGLCYAHDESLDLDLGFKRLFETGDTSYALLLGVTLRM